MEKVHIDTENDNQGLKAGKNLSSGIMRGT